MEKKNIFIIVFTSFLSSNLFVAHVQCTQRKVLEETAESLYPTQPSIPECYKEQQQGHSSVIDYDYNAYVLFPSDTNETDLSLSSSTEDTNKTANSEIKECTEQLIQCSNDNSKLEFSENMLVEKQNNIVATYFSKYDIFMKFLNTLLETKLDKPNNFVNITIQTDSKKIIRLRTNDSDLSFQEQKETVQN